MVYELQHTGEFKILAWDTGSSYATLLFDATFIEQAHFFSLATGRLRDDAFFILSLANVWRLVPYVEYVTIKLPDRGQVCLTLSEYDCVEECGVFVVTAAEEYPF